MWTMTCTICYAWTASLVPGRRKLRAIMGIDLPSEDYSPASEDDKETIRSKMNEAEKAVEVLVDDLRKKRYNKAAEYLERAQKGMFAYLVSRVLKSAITI